MPVDAALPVGAPPIDPPSRPSYRPPEGACDAHFHMLAADADFPLWQGRVEDPSAGRFADWIERYRRGAQALGLTRGVVVHSILFGLDNRVTLAAVDALGRENYRAICLAPDAASDADLDALADKGVVGLRLNYVHGGVLTFDGARTLAPRLAERGMHLQMLINAHKHMAEIAEAVRALPVPVVFDHFGWPDMAAGVQEPGFQTLRALVAEGAAWVKLSGVYRLSDAPYEAADAAVAALAEANPERCLWGTDWPHIMLADAKTPDSGTLLDAFARAVSGEAARRRILVDNPAGLYGF